VAAAERFQRGIVEGLGADREAIDASRRMLGEQRLVLGIGFERDLTIGIEHEGARSGVDQAREFAAAQQRWRAASEEQAGGVAAAEALGVRFDVGADGVDQR